MIAFTNIEYTIELTEALSELEDVMLMIPDKQKNRFKDVVDMNVELYGFYYPRIRNFSNILMISEIIRKISKFKPDIIHIQKGHPWFNLALPLLRRYCLLTTIHDVILLDWPSQRIPAFTYKPPIKYATQLIVHGQRLKETMVREFNRAADDIHVLPRGVNSIYTRYIDGPLMEEPHTILYFGRIWEYKGIRYLIEAEPFITEKIPDAKIIIAGEGENFEKYRKMMVHPERFTVLDKFIPHKMVAELFQKASLVVLPYIDGSQSGVIPQAYAFKKPVVITDVGSLPENVDHGITGYIVPPRDTKRLAEAIIDLLADDDKRKRMGGNAFKKTQEELAWKNIAPRTVEVYKKALALKSKGIQKS
jgi:glycosyltransferase involved in cell wall biosynthesis